MTQHDKMLSDIPFDSLMLDDEVIGLTGNKGKITGLTLQKAAPTQDDNMITIIWSNGRCSLICHREGKYVKYIGR